MRTCAFAASSVCWSTRCFSHIFFLLLHIAAMLSQQIRQLLGCRDDFFAIAMRHFGFGDKNAPAFLQVHKKIRGQVLIVPKQNDFADKSFLVVHVTISEGKWE